MIELRDYQEKGVQDIRNAISEGKHRILLVSPPGAGKGTVIGKIMYETAIKGNRALFVVHRKELVLQTAERTVKQFGYNQVGFYLSGVQHREKPCMFGSIQTIAVRRIANNFKVVIIDEGHRIKTPQYQKLLAELPPGVILIAFTATPFRTDKKSFEEDFDVLIQMCKYQELVDRKFLVPTRVVGPEVSPDLKGVHLRGGEYRDDELFERFNNERVYKGIVESWMLWGNGRRTIVYCVNSTEHCERVTEYFVKAGVDARAIHSKSVNRDQLYKAFQDREFPVLVNVNLFTEGISIDDVDCIVFAVATNSLTKYIQSATRASRPVWEDDYSDWKKIDGFYLKDHALIIDLGGNTERFGYVDDYDLIPFDLSGEPKKPGQAPTKTCPECRSVIKAQLKICPSCNYEFPWKPSKDKVFLDEVEFAEKNRISSLVTKWEKKSHYHIKKALTSIKEPTPGLLPVIAMIKGYKYSWAIHTAIDLNGVHGESSWIPFDPFAEADQKKALNEIFSYFTDKMKEEGVLKLYHELRKNNVEAQRNY